MRKKLPIYVNKIKVHIEGSTVYFNSSTIGNVNKIMKKIIYSNLFVNALEASFITNKK